MQHSTTISNVLRMSDTLISINNSSSTIDMPKNSRSSQGFRVLVIISRPLDLQDLPNVADQWALLDGLRRVNAPAYLKILRPPTVEGFRAEILGGYDIVHFDGHGGYGVRCINCGWLNSKEVEECSRCDHILRIMRRKAIFSSRRKTESSTLCLRRSWLRSSLATRSPPQSFSS